MHFQVRNNKISQAITEAAKLVSEKKYTAARILLLKHKKNSFNDKALNLLLGFIEFETDNILQAKSTIDKILADFPDDSDALNLSGLIYFKLGDFSKAKYLFLKLTELNSASSSLYFNLGNCFLNLNELNEASDAFHKALLIEPNNTKALINLGICFRKLNRNKEASFIFSKAISVNSECHDGYFFLGNTYREMGEIDNSIIEYRKAINLKPDYIEAAINCGNSYKDLGLANEAIDCYDTALKINPNHPEANYNKSLALLNDGQWEEGWPLYEWRFNSSEAQTKFVQQPLIENIDIWNGETLGGNLLVLPEQGIGDQVFFLGMLPDLQKKVKSLTVGADSRLTPLLRRTYPEIDFIQNASDVDTSRVNAQIHMGSLGQHLRRNENSFSSVVSPYLMADKLQSAALRQSMKADGKLLCGISWLSKNADHGNAKSLSLTALKDALTLPGFDFVDLQYGDTQHEREQFHADHGVRVIKRDEIDNFKDIDGLASLIDACDLVITVSNTTAHLACALGKPTLVLLPQSSAVFWYWHRKGMQSPWYPTAVMLRQEELGGWPQVVGAVRHILQGMQ